MPPADLILHAHRFCAAYMTGVIWFVQLVQYPMLDRIHGKDPASTHREYTRRMSLVVMPVMLAELALQADMLLRNPGPSAILCAMLLAVVWASTFLLQVPAHRELMTAFSSATHRELVRTNWIRTFAWTARAALLMRVV